MSSIRPVPECGRRDTDRCPARNFEPSRSTYPRDRTMGWISVRGGWIEPNRASSMPIDSRQAQSPFVETGSHVTGDRSTEHSDSILWQRGLQPEPASARQEEFRETSSSPRIFQREILWTCDARYSVSRILYRELISRRGSRDSPADRARVWDQQLFVGILVASRRVIKTTFVQGGERFGATFPRTLEPSGGDRGRALIGRGTWRSDP